MKGLPYIVGIVIAILGITTFEIKNGVNESNKKNSYTKKSNNSDWMASFPKKTFVFSKNNPGNMEFSFSVKGNYKHPITTEKLTHAKKLGDIIAYYPGNWITDYESVEISAVINGKEERASGINPSINENQKKLLQSVKLSTNINVTVNYKAKNAITNSYEDHQMKIALTVIPEKEAEFRGGYDNMIRYLKENSKNEIAEIGPYLTESAIILFTVSENGKITDIDLKKSSGHSKIDKLMYKIIRDMPDWEPAENLKGLKVNQNFEFTINPRSFPTNLNGQQDGC